MELSQAISARIKELLHDKGMTQYKLYTQSGVSKSTISSIVKCNYKSANLSIIHELCQGFNISLAEFFSSPLFDEENLEP